MRPSHPIQLTPGEAIRIHLGRVWIVFTHHAIRVAHPRRQPSVLHAGHPVGIGGG